MVSLATFPHIPPAYRDEREPIAHLQHHMKETYDFMEEVKRVGIATKLRVVLLPEATKWWNKDGDFKGQDP